MSKKKKKTAAPRAAGSAPQDQRPGGDMQKERPGTYYGMVFLATALLITPSTLFDTWFPQSDILGKIGAFCLGLGLWALL